MKPNPIFYPSKTVSIMPDGKTTLTYSLFLLWFIELSFVLTH